MGEMKDGNAVKASIISDSMCARAYRFGVAEALNVTLDNAFSLIADPDMDDDSMGKLAGTVDVLMALYSLLKECEKAHSEEILKLISCVDTKRLQLAVGKAKKKSQAEAGKAKKKSQE